MFAKETKNAKQCVSCNKKTKKKITGDEFADIYLICMSCGYTVYYDGEPYAMLMDGEYH